MKKLFFAVLTIVMVAVSINANAQSVQWHQSYDNNQKFVADFFKADEQWNWYSYNEFTVDNNQALGYAIFYGERRIAMSHFLVHAETRLRMGEFSPNFNSALYGMGNNMANIGFAYELILGNATFSLTPQYRYDFGTGSNWQFSINSSADWPHFYYEGYLDTWGPDSFNLCTEQKFYYKITNTIQIGVNAMVYNIADNWYFQPWLVGRLAF